MYRGLGYAASFATKHCRSGDQRTSTDGIGTYTVRPIAQDAARLLGSDSLDFRGPRKTRGRIMGTSPRRDVAVAIRRLLETHAYCDACLALHMEISLEEARVLAVALVTASDFIRKHRKCEVCSRTVETTFRAG